MRILFIGDIFGRPGRTIVRERLANLVKDRSIDLVIANGENAAAGFGITPAITPELLDLGIDVLTSGNHIWDEKEIMDFSTGQKETRKITAALLRPPNYPAGTPGWGVYEGRNAQGIPFAVVNLQGRVFMATIDDPFRMADQLEKIQSQLVIVDFHAEATSEKIALGWYLDGRVTAVVGTHTTSRPPTRGFSRRGPPIRLTSA